MSALCSEHAFSLQMCSCRVYWSPGLACTSTSFLLQHFWIKQFLTECFQTIMTLWLKCKGTTLHKVLAGNVLQSPILKYSSSRIQSPLKLVGSVLPHAHQPACASHCLIIHLLMYHGIAASTTHRTVFQNLGITKAYKACTHIQWRWFKLSQRKGYWKWEAYVTDCFVWMPYVKHDRIGYVMISPCVKKIWPCSLHWKPCKCLITQWHSNSLSLKCNAVHVYASLLKHC